MEPALSHFHQVPGKQHVCAAAWNIFFLCSPNRSTLILSQKNHWWGCQRSDVTKKYSPLAPIHFKFVSCGSYSHFVHDAAQASRQTTDAWIPGMTGSGYSSLCSPFFSQPSHFISACPSTLPTSNATDTCASSFLPKSDYASRRLHFQHPWGLLHSALDPTYESASLLALLTAYSPRAGIIVC